MKVRAKKYLGQHFLKDSNIAEKIVNSLSYNGYNHLLEIGPGTGILTKFLLKKNLSLSLSEIDKESIDYLIKNFPISPSQFIGDFLKITPEIIYPETAIIGNFPYNISSQIVFKIIENRKYIPEMLGMFQKEVAERICTQKGNKTYGILSVLTQTFYNAEYLFTVNENVFIPPPKVKSGVIRLTRKKEVPDLNESLYFKVVKAAFNQRRKTLRNALKVILNQTKQSEQTKQTENNNLATLPFMEKRAEQLSVNDFITLTHAVSEIIN